MINITLHATDCARSGDIEAKTICALARKLIEAGEEPSQDTVVTRNGTVCFVTTSLQWWAARTITEGDREPRFTKWVPFDRAQVEGAAQ